mgnify:CR=1 FL=1
MNTIYPRELVKAALARNASALVIAHNHPSGSLTPSRQDSELTRSLYLVCSFMHLDLLDHAVHGARQRHHAVHLRRPGTHGAMREHRLERGTDGRRPQQARSPRMHADDPVVVRPARAHLHPQLQKHLGVHQLFQFLAGFGANAFQAFALVANHHCLVGVAFDHDVGGNAHQAFVVFALFFGELLDGDGRGVGQLVACEAEQLFAHRLAGKKLFTAVGQLVGPVPPCLLYTSPSPRDQRGHRMPSSA